MCVWGGCGPFGRECFCLGGEGVGKNIIKRLEIVIVNQSVGVASVFGTKAESHARLFKNICAEVVEHDNGMRSRELVPAQSPFLYTHSATAHSRATLFKKSCIFLKKPNTRTPTPARSRPVRAMTSAWAIFIY